jgi:hypothetical protein
MEEFERLHEEGLLYYFRYLLFFRIGEYELCARDTERNLRLADFVLARGQGTEMTTAIEQYRPYIMRMQAVSVAVRLAKDGRLHEALERLIPRQASRVAIDYASTSRLNVCLKQVLLPTAQRRAQLANHVLEAPSKLAPLRIQLPRDNVVEHVARQATVSTPEFENGEWVAGV